MKLIAGLGNPGRKFNLSRHNLGFMVVNQLAQRHQAGIFWPRFQGRFARVKFAGEELGLLKPYTFMNLSGASVKDALKKFRLSPENLIVVHDDLDLALGQLKLGFGQGSAGHKGVESIIEHLGTNDFYRVRLGIGTPGEGQEVVDYVLSPFSEEELKEVKKMIELACQSIEVLIQEGLEQARNIFHRRT